MVSPSYRYLKRTGENANSNIDIGDYDLIADIISGSCVTTNTISSNKIKVGVIVNANWTDLTDGGGTTLHTHTGLSSAPAGSFAANIGSDYTFGVSGVKFVSSQRISGGAIKGSWIGNQITSSYITGYIASSVAIARFADSSNIRLRFPGSSQAISRYAPSRSVRNGLQTITNAYGEISHGISSIPNYWNVKPSGSSINFGITTKVDASKIYVYLTALGSRSVYWYASA